MIAEPVPAWDVALRLGAAVLCGAAIGLNRDLRSKPAGLRTHALVSLGAALIVLSTLEILPGSDIGAATRTIQGIITGIGFVGAGVILHPSHDTRVVGLTTAATIWMVACIGTACGAGQWTLATVGVVLSLAILVIGGPLEALLVRAMRARDARRREPATSVDDGF